MTILVKLYFDLLFFKVIPITIKMQISFKSYKFSEKCFEFGCGLDYSAVENFEPNQNFQAV